MKRKFVLGLALCALLTSTSVLASCGKKGDSSQQTSQDQTAEILNAAINSLTVPTSVEADFDLTVRAAGGVTIAWTSNNSAITIDQSRATVTRSRTGDVDVTLTAIASLGEKSSDPKSFTVTVKKLDITLPEGTITVKQAREAAIGSNVTVAGYVSAFVGGVSTSTNTYSPNGFYLTDETQTIYVFGYQVANKVSRGDFICITATVASYSDTVQLSSPNLVNDAVISSNNEIPDPASYAITGKTIGEIYNPTENPGIGGNTYILECYIITYSGSGNSGTYTNYEISTELENGKYMNIYSSASGLNCPENAWLDKYVEAKQKVKLAYYINSTNSKKTSYRGNVIYIYD